MEQAIYISPVCILHGPHSELGRKSSSLRSMIHLAKSRHRLHQDLPRMRFHVKTIAHSLERRNTVRSFLE